MATVPPPVAVRERLLAAITTAVGGVYRVPSAEDERDLPLVFVQDGPDEASSNYDFVRLVMPVSVAHAAEAVSTDRAEQRAQAHEMLADLVAAMQADETFGGLAQGVELVGVSINTELGKLVFAESSWQVTYRHLRGDARALEVPPEGD